jgi:hypothetical protein
MTLAGRQHSVIDDSGPAPAERSWRPASRTNIASFKFEWLAAIVDAVADKSLTPIAASIAIKAAEFLGDRRTFFMSHKDAGALVGRTENVAGAALNKMTELGYLVVLVGKDRPHRPAHVGRLATDYRAEIPPKVSCGKLGETKGEDSNGKLGETKGVSPRKLPPLSPRKLPPIIVEYPVEGSRALSASAYSGCGGDISGDKATSVVQGSHALEARDRPAPAPATCGKPLKESEHPDCRTAATLEDLDRVCAEERAAAELYSDPPDDADFSRARSLLVDVHGDRLGRDLGTGCRLIDQDDFVSSAPYTLGPIMDSDDGRNFIAANWQLINSHGPERRPEVYAAHVAVIREIALADPELVCMADGLAADFEAAMLDYGAYNGFTIHGADARQCRVAAHG